MTHQQICRVIPRQALLRRLLPLGCGRLIACRHAGGPACVACTGSLPAAFSEQLRAGARLFEARAGSCFTIPPVIKSLQAGCGPVVAGMPACQTCRPTVWNGTSGFVVRPVMPGVSRRLAACCGRGGPWHGLSGKSITPMGCGPWPWLVSCCRTVARRCMPSVTCFSPLPSLLAVRPHRRAVPSGISPCQSLWP